MLVKHDNCSPTTTSSPLFDFILLGFYMYIDSTSRKQGDKARLLSPQMPKTRAQCLQFWYHMYGSSVGSLSVYKKTGNPTGPRIWTLSGDQGDEWLVAQVSVWSPIRPFQISFQGTVGRADKGDIAIDDISIVKGKCAYPGNCQYWSFVLFLNAFVLLFVWKT